MLHEVWQADTRKNADQALDRFCATYEAVQVVSREERRAMLESGHSKLSLSCQCRLLRVSRSSVYHRPKGESARNLALMRSIDELFLN